jgi:hypothetical protein
MILVNTVINNNNLNLSILEEAIYYTVTSAIDYFHFPENCQIVFC